MKPIYSMCDNEIKGMFEFVIIGFRNEDTSVSIHYNNRNRSNVERKIICIDNKKLRTQYRFVGGPMLYYLPTRSIVM